MKQTILLFFLISFLDKSAIAQIKQRVDLDDIKIKGEAQGQGMTVLTKTKNDISSRVNVRTSYKKEILDNLPENFSWPEANLDSKKKRFSH